MSKELFPLKGIVTVLNTPFTRDNRLDLAGLKKNMAYALKSGVAGFLVPAMASEVYKLSFDERIALVETALEEAGTRAVVIGGAGETNPARRTKMARRLLQAGCRNLLLQIPFAGEKRFQDDVMRVADLGPAMLMIQDWDFRGNGLPLGLICRLFEEVDSFRCLKIETVPAGPKYTAVLKATGGRLNVSGGWAVSSMIEALERGVHAFMPTGMHEIYCLIYRLFQGGRKPEANEWFTRLLPVLAFSNQHLDISIHFFKRLLHAQGIYATSRVRPPIMAFDRFHERHARTMIGYAIGLMKTARACQEGIVCSTRKS
ncbi:MAG: dihydrodipicolinate synthase family protein [Kiritimatiellia bacterium]